MNTKMISLKSEPEHDDRLMMMMMMINMVQRERVQASSDCFQLYTPSRTLRPTSDTLSFQIPRTRLSTVGSVTYLFCHRFIDVVRPPPSCPTLSNPLWTPSNQTLRHFFFSPKLDLPCFPFRAGVYLRLKSVLRLCCARC